MSEPRLRLRDEVLILYFGPGEYHLPLISQETRVVDPHPVFFGGLAGGVFYETGPTGARTHNRDETPGIPAYYGLESGTQSVLTFDMSGLPLEVFQRFCLGYNDYDAHGKTRSFDRIAKTYTVEAWPKEQPFTPPGKQIVYHFRLDVKDTFVGFQREFKYFSFSGTWREAANRAAQKSKELSGYGNGWDTPSPNGFSFVDIDAEVTLFWGADQIQYGDYRVDQDLAQLGREGYIAKRIKAFGEQVVTRTSLPQVLVSEVYQSKPIHWVYEHVSISEGSVVIKLASVNDLYQTESGRGQIVDIAAIAGLIGLSKIESYLAGAHPLLVMLEEAHTEMIELKTAKQVEADSLWPYLKDLYFWAPSDIRFISDGIVAASATAFPELLPGSFSNLKRADQRLRQWLLYRDQVLAMPETPVFESFQPVAPSNEERQKKIAELRSKKGLPVPVEKASIQQAEKPAELIDLSLLADKFRIG